MCAGGRSCMKSHNGMVSIVSYLSGTGLLTKSEGTDMFDEGVVESMRGNSGVYMHFIDMFAPCIVGDAVWNAKPNPLDRVVQQGARLDTVLTVSDEAFMLLCFRNYSAKWKGEVLLELEQRKRKNADYNVSFVSRFALPAQIKCGSRHGFKLKIRKG